jgi:hypothetical protein
VSTILYGRLVSRREVAIRDATEDPTKKAAEELAQLVAALVPAEVLTIHAAILAGATETGADGSTAVTKPEVLKWSLVILGGTCVLLYLIGKVGFLTTATGDGLQRLDALRMVIPALAFGAWTCLTGTSAMTPWAGDIERLWLVLAGGCAAVLLLALAKRLAPGSP